MKSANISLYYEHASGEKTSNEDEVENDEYLINLVDTPGHLDFSGKVTRALRLIDGVVVIVDSVEEISSQTETVVRQALEEAARPILFINKIDRLFNELKLDSEQIKEKFSRIISDFNKLIYMYGREEVKEKWAVSAENGSVMFGSALHRWGFIIPQILKNKHSISYFADHYASKTHKKLQNIYPVWEAVLKSVVTFLPNPLEAQKYRVQSIWKGDLTSELGRSMTKCDPKGPLVVCFSKVQKMKNRLIGTGRIFSGTIDLKDRVYLVNADAKSYIQQLSIFMGSRLESVKQIPAGNIVSIGGIAEIKSGETIVDTKHIKDAVPFEKVKYVSEPVLTVSVEPNMLKDLDQLESILNEIIVEDPNLTIDVSKDTGEVLLSGMGPLHLEVASKMIQERGIDVSVSEPTSVFYESVDGSSRTHEAMSPNGLNKIKLKIERLENKQVQYFREVEERVITNTYLREKSLRENGNFNEEDIKGFLHVDRYHNLLISHVDGLTAEVSGKEAILKDKVVSIVENMCKSGMLAQEPYSEVKITIHELFVETVEDDYNYFDLATMIQDCFTQCLDELGPILIEPLYFMIITCPENYIGKVVSLINQFQGKILQIKNKEYNGEINATMSVRKSIDFSQDVRSKTSGKVFWNCIFDSFHKVSEGEKQQIIQDIKFRKGLF